MTQEEHEELLTQIKEIIQLGILDIEKEFKGNANGTFYKKLVDYKNTYYNILACIKLNKSRQELKHKLNKMREDTKL